MDFGISGLASGFDWRSLIDQLSDVERLPQKRLLVEQGTLEERNNAYGSILTQLKVFQGRVATLKSADLFDSRQATVGDATVASASVSSGAVHGNFNFQFNQLATSARQIGMGDAGQRLSATPDVSGLTLADAGFVSPVTDGTFRVNGAAVSITTSDTLEDVFSKIATATGGAVAGSYNPTTDRIELSGASPIVLGSATDTSNFLQIARLHNNGTNQIESTGELGGVRLAATLGAANLAIAPDFGATGKGMFRINGVEIEFSAADTVSSVLKRIDASAAGVAASYDSLNDRFVLANKTTGDVGVALEDVRGNFLAATRLGTGTLERGKDLLYSINGGGELRSHSNIITESSSGLTGLSVTALKEGGSTQVSIATDASKIKAAITGFIDAYNKAQSVIATQTASSTDADGKVTASTLTAEGDADNISSMLRRLTYGVVQGMGLNLSHLEALGIDSNSNDDSLSLADPTKLDDALANRLSSVRDLWTDSTDGIATRLDAYLTKTAGEDGFLSSKQGLLTRQASDINVQVADLERVVQSNRARLLDSFVSMERAQANINQQMQFLSQRFGT